MTPGDIIRMPSGRRARYEGGSKHGAEFVYLDDDDQPVRDPRCRSQKDTFCLSSVRLLMRLQPE